MFREALKITNNCLILTIPLIIFVKLLDLYSMFSRYNINTTPKFLVASVTVLFMFAVFSAGWLYMVKSAVSLSKKVFVLDKDRINATMKLFKSMLTGIGKYCLSFLGAFLFYIFIIQVIAVQTVYLVGAKLIGTIDASSIQELTSSDNSAIMNFVDNMTPEQIIFFGKWSLLFMIMTSVVMYLLMLWFPEIIYKKYNPIKALGTSVVSLFKDFKTTFVIFIVLWLIGFVILFANTFSLINPFLYLFINVLLFYFATYSVVTVFLYYDNKYGE